MAARPEDHTDEIRRLRRCINDLVSITSLSAVWTGRDQIGVVQTLIDALLPMLRLDFAYVRIKDSDGEVPLEILQVAPSLELTIQPGEAGALISRWLGPNPQQWSTRSGNLFGYGNISVAPTRLGLRSGSGVLVAGASRADFPTQVETLLLSVATNQAAIGLQDALLLDEERRLAGVLDRRVAQRTSELAAANEELRKQISERRRVEGRWRRIIDNSAIGVAVADLDGRLEITNAAFQKMVGFSEKELKSMNFLDLTEPAFREQNGLLTRELLDGKRDQFNIEKQYRRRDGRPIWARNNVSLIPGTDGIPRNLMAIIEDISSRKAAEESLRLTQVRLARAAQIATAAELSVSIAHEVNQPLSGIITNANTCLRMLGAEPPNVEGARETARRTLRDGNRAAEIVTRLRALFGKRPPQLELVDLNEAITEVIALSVNNLQMNRVTLETKLTAGHPVVMGDRVQLQQVILNLVQNATDAMLPIEDRPRRLLIKTEEDGGDRVRLSIQDSGVGLDPGSVERLFDSFYTTKKNGIGMGLSVSRSIIESHNGRLWAEPNAGPGATFFFAIPRQTDDRLDGLAV